MKNGLELTQEYLMKLMSYDKDTGVFLWKENRGGRFLKGKEAGYINRDGYRVIGIGGVHYNAGYLAWLYVTGRHPVNYADHKNLIRDDNRFDNLREATKSQNMINRDIPRGGTSQYRGVRFYQKTKRWACRIQVRKNPIFVGYFADEEEAARAYDAAAIEHFGEFARLNFPFERRAAE